VPSFELRVSEEAEQSEYVVDVRRCGQDYGDANGSDEMLHAELAALRCTDSKATKLLDHHPGGQADGAWDEIWVNNGEI
jgi:hypothetical protein